MPASRRPNFVRHFVQFRRALRPALLALLTAAPVGASAQTALEADILYLARREAPPATLSNLDPAPEDAGIAGARLGLKDNADTGRFLGHVYAMEELTVAEGAPLLILARAALGRGPRVVVADLPMADLLAVADLPEARGALILNAGAPDDALRGAECRANVLHAGPSRAMLADALTQFLVKRRWTDWLLIEGERPGDAAFADALRRSADKFGARLRGEKVWRFDANMRRNAAAEAPTFTQGPDYDVVMVADEPRDFARYLPYNTWLPRPIAGSEGLRPTAWSRVVEQWGAAQLQTRFRDMAGRDMGPEDWNAWAAVRAVGEGVTRTGAADPAALRAYLLSDAFALAVFKGRPASFRAWNGQMRQPVPLVHAGAVAAMAPLEGFLHARTELDTLGLDAPESPCNAFAANGD